MPEMKNVPAPVLDLLGRMRELEHPDGSWPGADTVQVLCEWFASYGVDVDANDDAAG